MSQSTDGGIRVVQENVQGGGVGLNQIVKLGKGKYVGCINFVKGGLLEGTLCQNSVAQVARVEEKAVGIEGRKRKKRKRGERAEESRAERKKRRGEEKAAKEERRRLRREKRMSKSRIHEGRKQRKSESSHLIPPTEEKQTERMSPPPIPLVSREEANKASNEIPEPEVKVRVKKVKKRKGEKKTVEKCVPIDSST